MQQVLRGEKEFCQRQEAHSFPCARRSTPSQRRRRSGVIHHHLGEGEHGLREGIPPGSIGAGIFRQCGEGMAKQDRKYATCKIYFRQRTSDVFGICEGRKSSQRSCGIFCGAASPQNLREKLRPSRRASDDRQTPSTARWSVITSK